MHGLIVAESSGGWSLGGSIWTFAFPMALFIVVATTLYFLYTRPHTVPGHRRAVAPARPVPPHPAKAADLAAAAGMTTAAGGGGEEPLAERDTPPVADAASTDPEQGTPAEGTEAAE